MLDVRRLRLLRELAHRDTIAAVAEALSFTPSAVSQQLAVLEREAGVDLLERTGRRVALTPAGRRLVVHAEAVLARLEQATAELAATRDGLAGPLRIGAFPSAARVLVPAALAALCRDHPDLEPMVEEIDPARVADAIRAGELDLALIHDYDFVTPQPDPGLDSMPLLDESMYLAAPPPTIRTDWTSTAPKEVRDPIRRWRDAPWIMAAPGTLCHAMTLRACEAAGFAPRIRHHVDDFSTVLALVAVGQGVALVPQFGTTDTTAELVLTPLAMRRRTRIAYRRGAGDHPAIAAFTTALRNILPHP